MIPTCQEAPEAEFTRDPLGDVAEENADTLASVIRKDMEKTAVGSSPEGTVLAGGRRNDSKRLSGDGSIAGSVRVMN